MSLADIEASKKRMAELTAMLEAASGNPSDQGFGVMSDDSDEEEEDISTFEVPEGNPKGWTIEQVQGWLVGLENKMLAYREVFESKGWTQEELSKWTETISADFKKYRSSFRQQWINGVALVSLDPSSELEDLGMGNRFIRMHVARYLTLLTK